MNRLKFAGIAIVFAFALASCASYHPTNSTIKQEYLKESWPYQMKMDPKDWSRNADPWYFTGQPGQLSQYAIKAPPSAAITDSMVRVRNFTKINVNGTFRVQIFGGQDRNSVEIMGPNVAARQVAVAYDNDTLYVHPTRDSNMDLGSVVVRIGIKNLRGLWNCGRGDLFGRNITSDHLTIISQCYGNILLNGNMNLARVVQTGSGTVSVIGAYTPSLRVNMNGMGNVNISGRVGVESITNYGRMLNILGADSAGLVINAGGASITRVAGYSNVKRITAVQDSRVYLYWTDSKNLAITECDKAIVGIAGCSTNLNLNMAGASCFQGQYLLTHNANVRTRDWAHANVSADHRAFTEAAGNSSIYFFGPPGVLSRFVSEDGVIIAAWTNQIPTPTMPLQQAYQFDFKGQQTSHAYTTPYSS